MIIIELQFDPTLARLAHTKCIHRTLPEPTSLKDACAAAGIPSCEIGQIDGAGDLDVLLTGGEIVALAAVRRVDAGDGRFLCDGHLGKLARLLRTLGVDTTWNDAWTEPEIARRSLNEGRIVLSGNRALLKRAALTRAMLIADDDPDLQTAAVVRRFDLFDHLEPFGRCPLCNGEVEMVAKSDVAERIPPRTAAWRDTYYVCAGCDQLYWEGTHVLALRSRIDRILAAARKDPA
ncbi:hypothetical protein DRQ50_07030 [bacterium]|nr:MAG: hypothetical protein DRQ50_07030 [bacterium]